MIPPEQLNPGAVQLLVEYLSEEIHRALGERRPLEEKWKRWHSAYKAEPEQDVKTFPFYGASNLVIPVIGTDVDVIYARLMGILFAPDNFFSTRAKQPEMVDFAPRLQEFLQAVQFKELNIFEAVADFSLECIKLGTAVLKTRYRREHKTVYEFRETFEGVIEQHRNIRTKDNPEIKHVSLYDFILPASAIDVQNAPWCAERVLLTWPQFMNRVREGVYTYPPALQNWSANSKGSHVLEDLYRLDSFSPGVGRFLEFYECWLDYDITGSGEPRSIVATIHLPTWSVVRVDWNPYLSQDRPYDFARFMRQEKRFYGIGMCEMLESFQDEVTAMHNQRIDSGTLANSTMFKGRRGVINEGEPVYPGRWFMLDDMGDVEVLNTNAGKFDSSIQYEPLTMQYAKHRSGVNEHVAGQFAPSIGYATAHTNMQQLQQATQRFDQTLREHRAAFSGAAEKATELYQQFDRPGKVYQILGEADGAIMDAFIKFPTELVRNGVGIEVTATSASLNKENEIRTNTILMQMLTQFYREVVDGLGFAFTPGLPPQLQAVIFQMVQGGVILMRRILDAHGVQDVDDLVPHIREILSGNLPIGQLAGDAFRAGQTGTSNALANGGIQGNLPLLSQLEGLAGSGVGANGINAANLPPSRGNFPM
jgi:hypothetical protein